MTLGTDKTACAAELREAMRAQLDTLDPPSGSNVDRPEVSSNFDALGDGVWRILTQDAETLSEGAQDPTFWNSIAGLRNEVEALRLFCAGVQTAFNNWNPALPASGTTLKTAITGLTVPTTTPDPPTRLNGKIR